MARRVVRYIKGWEWTCELPGVRWSSHFYGFYLFNTDGGWHLCSPHGHEEYMAVQFRHAAENAALYFDEHAAELQAAFR